MHDFTLKIYKEFLSAILQNGYTVLTFEDFVSLATVHYPIIVIRHDVDAKPERALEMAKLEYKMGIKSTYYFRIKTDQQAVVQQIAAFGHEIGYHYEDLAASKGDLTKAITHFAENLLYLRQFYPIKTIAMHGSPLSPYHNLDLWKTFDYKDYGIIAEPSLFLKEKAISEPVDYYYLTDTGRCWDGDGYNVRDKIDGCKNGAFLQVHTTADLIRILSSKFFCKNNTSKFFFLLTLHPQRWTDSFVAWMAEFICQNVKNIVKQLMKKERI
ncbi:MAG: hypothetical protein LBN27_10805 [Prevotellaceae bacterium]|jgi:hypothetical protein|nr:hypothetical protein [Prevotellaceae bacterium]